MAALSDPPTTITVRQSTRFVPESVKATGQTYDELLRGLVEEHYPTEWIAELNRRMSRGPRGRSDTEVYRRPRQ